MHITPARFHANEMLLFIGGGLRHQLPLWRAALRRFHLLGSQPLAIGFFPDGTGFPYAARCVIEVQCHLAQAAQRFTIVCVGLFFVVLGHDGLYLFGVVGLEHAQQLLAMLWLGFQNLPTHLLPGLG